MLENTIMARDGEALVLGGFTRTVDRKVRRRFPGLGVILPFLFSRDVVEQSHHESLIVITPHVVALDATLNPKSREMLNGE